MGNWKKWEQWEQWDQWDQWIRRGTDLRDRAVEMGEPLLDLLYPPRCPLCEGLLSPVRKPRRACAWPELVCGACREKLPWVREPVCKKCGRPLEEGSILEYCPECACRERPFAAGHCAFLYRDAMRDSVLRMKFRNRREYLDFYAAALAWSGRQFLKSVRPDAIVPVPVSRKRRRERGFDQCLLLAGKLSQRTGIPLAGDLLLRTRSTSAQSGLDYAGRRKNVQGAFQVKERAGRPLPHRILLLDDIFTTGSTAEECTRTLLEAGAEQVVLMMLCTRSL